MINVDWTSVTVGLAAGTLMGAFFFLGLAFGMRIALRTKIPIKVLALSAALRIAALLGVGWAIVQQGGPWSTLGFGIAFFVIRFIATTCVRAGAPAGETP